MQGPHRTPAPGYDTAWKHKTTASQVDHRAIFSPERAPHKGRSAKTATRPNIELPPEFTT
jgi:hypothetical protein